MHYCKYFFIIFFFILSITKYSSSCEILPDKKDTDYPTLLFASVFFKFIENLDDLNLGEPYNIEKENLCIEEKNSIIFNTDFYPFYILKSQEPSNNILKSQEPSNNKFIYYYLSVDLKLFECLNDFFDNLSDFSVSDSEVCKLSNPISQLEGTSDTKSIDNNLAAIINHINHQKNLFLKQKSIELRQKSIELMSNDSRFLNYGLLPNDIRENKWVYYKTIESLFYIPEVDTYVDVDVIKNNYTNSIMMIGRTVIEVDV